MSLHRALSTVQVMDDVQDHRERFKIDAAEGMKAVAVNISNCFMSASLLIRIKLSQKGSSVLLFFKSDLKSELAHAKAKVLAYRILFYMTLRLFKINIIKVVSFSVTSIF